MEKNNPRELKVLIVDDDPVIRNVLSRYFTKHGYTIFETDSGKEAIQIFVEHKPDVILLDVMMPIMTGPEILVELRKISTSFKAIILSAVRDEETFRKCQKLGVVDYLLKPVELKHLDAVVMGKILRDE